MRRGTALVPTRDGQSHHQVQVIHLETSDDIVALRQDEAWHEDAMRILRYPTAPAQGFLTHEPPPKAFGGGIRFMPGAYITKDEAGNFGFLRDEQAFQEESTPA